MGNGCIVFISTDAVNNNSVHVVIVLVLNVHVNNYSVM